jgi:hypothetical protein
MSISDPIQFSIHAMPREMTGSRLRIQFDDCQVFAAKRGKDAFGQSNHELRLLAIP